MRFLAAEAEHAVSIIDTLPYGLIAMGIFALLAWITYSYRDVANRHDHKDSGSKGH